MRRHETAWGPLRSAVGPDAPLPVQLSLPEVNSSVRVPAAHQAWYKKMWCYAGLGFLVSVGYMDPGNWWAS